MKHKKEYKRKMIFEEQCRLDELKKENDKWKNVSGGLLTAPVIGYDINRVYWNMINE